MSQPHKIFIRTNKRDSAFIYAVLEAHEGLAAYTTLPHVHHSQSRTLALLVPDELKSDLMIVLQELHSWVEVLEDDPSKE